MSTQSTISKKSALADPAQVSESYRKRPKMTVPAFTARKGGEPLVCLTAYTAHVARIVDEVADLILVPKRRWSSSTCRSGRSRKAPRSRSAMPAAS